MSMDDHSGKAVLVVGGTSGINLGIALAFARAGAHVAVVSRSPDKVAAAVEQLRALAAPGARGALGRRAAQWSSGSSPVSPGMASRLRSEAWYALPSRGL